MWSDLGKYVRVYHGGDRKHVRNTVPLSVVEIRMRQRREGFWASVGSRRQARDSVGVVIHSGGCSCLFGKDDIVVCEGQDR